MISPDFSRSRFRSSLHLKEKDKLYVKQKGLETIRSHALDFLNKRIKVKPKNDTKQTPFKGHPVFIAQHATATCCRKCIERWYKIPKDKELTEKEISDLSNKIIDWIRDETLNK